MTTKIKIINESSNTGSDVYNVVVKRAYNGNPETELLASLSPGNETEIYVWTGHRITIEEA